MLHCFKSATLLLLFMVCAAAHAADKSETITFKGWNFPGAGEWKTTFTYFEHVVEGNVIKLYFSKVSHGQAVDTYAPFVKDGFVGVSFKKGVPSSARITGVTLQMKNYAEGRAKTVTLYAADDSAKITSRTLKKYKVTSSSDFHIAASGLSAGYLRFDFNDNDDKSNQVYIESITVSYRLNDGSDDIPRENVTLTIGPTGYSTLYYSDRPLQVPEDITATTYYVDADGLNLSRTYAATDADGGAVIPMGEAVVLGGEPGSYTFAVAVDYPENDWNSQLKGSDEAAVTHGGAVYYKLAVDATGGNVGFYYGATDGAAFTSGAHKAYLAVPAVLVKKALAGFPLGRTTGGIAPVAVPPAHAGAVTRNLAGQRVGPSYRGLVVRGGKKMLVR